MVFRPNNLGTLKPFLHTSLYSAVELIQFAVELVQQLVAEVDEPVLLVRVPVLVVAVKAVLVAAVKVVKVHWQSQDFLVNSELSWL